MADVRIAVARHDDPLREPAWVRVGLIGAALALLGFIVVLPLAMVLSSAFGDGFRAWWNALQCPSPSNLRTARARWVLLNGEGLTLALPILEGCPDFEFIGAYGPETPDERYRLYHYKGSWEEQDNAWWQIRHIDPPPNPADERPRRK